MVVWPRAFVSRSNRIVAVGRVILAAVSLIAIWLDPSQPSRYADETYMLLAVYLTIASGLLPIVWRGGERLAEVEIVTHIGDLVVFALLMYLTEGPTSPFFVLYAFALLAATLRWQWRGALWTAVVAIAVLVSLGIFAGQTLSGSEFELNRTIIRTFYLAVMAAMLIFIGIRQERMQKELLQLVSWPGALATEPEQPIREILAYAGHVIDASRLVMTWTEDDEPWLNLAFWSSTDFQQERLSPEIYEPLVAEPLSFRHFYCADASSALPKVECRESGSLVQWQGVPLNPDFRKRFGIGPVLSLRLPADTADGRLFVLDRHNPSSNDFLIGEVVAGQVAVRLDQLDLIRRLRETVVTQERLRVARDLHDGALQSLAGTALQLHSIRGLLPDDPTAAERRLGEIEQAISVEQGELRALIRRLRPEAADDSTSHMSLSPHIRELTERLRGQWDLDIRWTVEPANLKVAPALVYEISRLISESAANAKRHGGATRFDIAIMSRGDCAMITVNDDGRGFPFRGQYPIAELVANKLGPLTLCERIAAIGGSLMVDSRENGATLSFSVPLGDSLRPT